MLAAIHLGPTDSTAIMAPKRKVGDTGLAVEDRANKKVGQLSGPVHRSGLLPQPMALLFSGSVSS